MVGRADVTMRGLGLRVLEPHCYSLEFRGGGVSKVGEGRPRMLRKHIKHVLPRTHECYDYTWWHLRSCAISFTQCSQMRCTFCPRTAYSCCDACHLPYCAGHGALCLLCSFRFCPPCRWSHPCIESSPDYDDTSDDDLSIDQISITLPRPPLRST